MIVRDVLSLAQLALPPTPGRSMDGVILSREGMPAVALRDVSERLTDNTKRFFAYARPLDRSGNGSRSGEAVWVLRSEEFHLALDENGKVVSEFPATDLDIYAGWVDRDVFLIFGGQNGFPPTRQTSNPGLVEICTIPPPDPEMPIDVTILDELLIWVVRRAVRIFRWNSDSRKLETTRTIEFGEPARIWGFFVVSSHLAVVVMSATDFSGRTLTKPYLLNLESGSYELLLSETGDCMWEDDGLDPLTMHSIRLTKKTGWRIMDRYSDGPRSKRVSMIVRYDFVEPTLNQLSALKYAARIRDSLPDEASRAAFAVAVRNWPCPLGFSPNCASPPGQPSLQAISRSFDEK
jgi:hypothetical protein